MSLAKPGHGPRGTRVGLLSLRFRLFCARACTMPRSRWACNKIDIWSQEGPQRTDTSCPQKYKAMDRVARELASRDYVPSVSEHQNLLELAFLAAYGLTSRSQAGRDQIKPVNDLLRIWFIFHIMLEKIAHSVRRRQLVTPSLGPLQNITYLGKTGWYGRGEPGGFQLLAMFTFIPIYNVCIYIHIYIMYIL